MKRIKKTILCMFLLTNLCTNSAASEMTLSEVGTEIKKARQVVEELPQKLRDVGLILIGAATVGTLVVIGALTAKEAFFLYWKKQQAIPATTAQ